MSENTIKIILEAADKTKEAFQSIKSSSASLASTLKEHWVAFSAAAIGSIYAVKKAFDFGKEIASNLNDIQKQAEMIGLTTTEYQKLSYAAKMSDVSNESLRMGMKGLSLSMGQFVDETGDGYEVLKTLGLSAVDATGKQKPLNQMLMEIADKFSSYADGAAKVDYANKLMGRSGMDLIMMLNKGKEGIVGYGEELVKMGGLIDKNIIRKGSEAEDAFKNIDVQIKSMKSNLAPVISLMADLGESVTRYLTPGFKELGERISSTFGEKVKVMSFKSVDELIEYSKKMAEKLPMPKLLTTPPEPGWIKKWVEAWDALTYSFEQLGIQSQKSLTKIAENAVAYLGQVKKAFQEGKATVTDYKNALIAATEAIKKATGEDQTKKLVDLYEASQKEIDAISKDDPDRAKKVQAIIDKWIEARKTITQTLAEAEANYKEMLTRLNQFKIEPGIDIGKAKASLKELEKEMKELRRQAEVPIKIQVDTSALDAVGRSLDQFTDQAPLPVEMEFYGIGSPKKHLSDKIQDFISEFGGLENAISAIQSTISFKEYGMEVNKLQASLDRVNSIYKWVWSTLVESASSHMIGTWFDPSYAARIFARQKELEDQIGILKMKRAIEELKMYEDSYQTGIPYVPKTGLYRLHKGEEVRTTNQVAMDYRGMTVIINESKNPRATAEEIEKVFKYNLHSGLKDVVKRLK